MNWLELLSGAAFGWTFVVDSTQCAGQLGAPIYDNSFPLSVGVPLFLN